MTKLAGPQARVSVPGSRSSRLAIFFAALGASALAVSAGFHHHRTIGPFAGPLFGIEFGPHDILGVADASIGLIPVGHGEPIPLPGVTDLSVASSKLAWAVTGAGDNPQADTGQGVHIVRHDGSQEKIANLFLYEEQNNPHTQFGAVVPDSNPFDVEALGKHAALVVDAGGNDLLRVRSDGTIELLAVFPTRFASTENVKTLANCPDPLPPFAGLCDLPDAIPSQPVPTSIAVDKHGYIYVGELRGFPAPANESSIWRVSPHASGAICPSDDCVEVFAGGFTSIIDLAFGPDGWLYVAELDEASWAAVEIFGTPTGGTINACSLKFRFCFKVASGIEELTAIAFDEDGDLWATRHALVPGAAEVVRVRTLRHDHHDRGRHLGKLLGHLSALKHHH